MGDTSAPGLQTPSYLTLPYLAYALTVLEAGYKENALRRPPVPYLGLARELRLRNAGTAKDLLNPTQVDHLAAAIRSLSPQDRERVQAYAQEALKAIGGIHLEAADSEELDEDPPLDPSLQAHCASTWVLPSLDLLEYPAKSSHIAESSVRALEQRLQVALNNFRNLRAEVRQEYTRIGPRVIRLGILPTGKPLIEQETGAPRRDATGHIIYETRTTISQIAARASDIQAVLEAKSIRLEKPVPGTSFVGVEIPNPHPALVCLREVLESNEYQEAVARSKLAVALGKDVAGQVRVGDLARMPHLLIAGATGSGKSVLLNGIIACLLTQATPDDVRMWMVDPKMVELTLYSGIPHLLAPVVTEVDKVVPLLKNAIAEMERRYRLFSQLGVRNIVGYRKLRRERITRGDTSLSTLPNIVMIIDELADLMMVAPEEAEDLICRLAQLARATGIHLVIATQRPSVDVITGLIKANIPTRISFMVSSAVDSRTILDMGGAEQLLGGGDMLYLPASAGKPERVQGAFLTDEEAERLADYWRQAQPSVRTHHMPFEDEWLNHEQSESKNGGNAGGIEQDRSYEDSDDDEALVASAIAKIIQQHLRWLSKSWLQREFAIGYQRSDRIMKNLAEQGVVAAKAEGKRGERRVILPVDETGQVEDQEIDDRDVPSSGAVSKI